MFLVLGIGSAIAACVFAFIAWKQAEENRLRSAARVAALSAALEPQAATADQARPVAVASLFNGDRTDGRPRPVIAVGAVALAMLAIAVTVAVQSAPRGGQVGTSAAATLPLELLSMRHARHDGGFVVTGLVRNPAGGVATDRVSVIVFAFDRNGTFLTSGRAPIDLLTLAPGDESPFVVTLPDADAVGRYRVTFRTDAGVVRHVDRRSEPGTLATNGR